MKQEMRYLFAKLLRAGKHEQVLEQLRELPLQTEPDLDSLYYQGIVSHYKGDREQAEKYYKEVLRGVGNDGSESR